MRLLKRIAVVLVLALVVASPGVASANLFVYSGPAANDVDNAAPTTVDLVVVDSRPIVDLNVSLLMDASCCVSDMTVTLQHVDTGTTVLLWGSDGGNIGIGDLDVLFDDEAAFPLPYPGTNVSGTFQPQGLLSAFDGETIGGTWRLTFVDPSGFDGEGDDLISWSISGTTIPEPTTAGLGLLTLAGLILRRRRIA